MAKYIPAWQKAMWAALRDTAWEQLNLEEQQAMREFIAEKSKVDEARTSLLLQQTLAGVRAARRMSPVMLILLWTAILVAAPVLTLLLGTKWLAPALLMCIVWLWGTAKSTRVRQIWKNRQNGGEGVARALRAMYQVKLRSPLAAVDKIKLSVMLAGLVLSAAVAVVPELPSQARTVAQTVGRVTAGDAQTADVLALLPEGTKGLDLLKKAMRNTAYGSDEEFLLVALMLMHMEQDPALKLQSDDHGVVSKYTPRALKNTMPAQINTPVEIEALALMLSYATDDVQQSTLRRFLQEKTLAVEVLMAFGSAMLQGREQHQLLTLCDEITAAGHDPVPFLAAYAARYTAAQAMDLVTGAGDAHRQLLIRALSSCATTLDDVLAYIRLAGEYGASAVDCYPDGAVLDLDTSKWRYDTSGQATSLGLRNTYLVLRRTEKPEPLTSFTVPEGEKTGRNEELAMKYENYDPDEDLGMAQYTVVLDTAALDVLPAEHIPQSLDTCDALIILDTWYVCESYVRETRSLMVDFGQWKVRQIDTPCFAACQTIDVYNVRSGNYLFGVKQNVVQSPAALELNNEFVDEVGWDAGVKYIAVPDEAWMAEARADFLNALERRNWRLVP